MRKALKVLGIIIYLFLGISALLALNNFFVGDFLKGNLGFYDAPFNLHVVEWLDQWFPRFPQWYPLQGMGMSLVRGYPVFAHLFTVIFSKLTPFNLQQSYELVCYLIPFLTALGIYVFAWVKLKNQTIALLSGLLYFLSSVSTKWLTSVGLYAQSFSIIFVPWALLGLTMYLDKVFKNEQGFARRLWFLLTVLSLSLAAVSHLITFVVVVEGLFLYGLFYSLFSSFRLKNLSQSFLRIGLIVFLAVFLAAVIFLPVIDYRRLASRENLLLPSAGQIEILPPMILFGLTVPSSGDLPHLAFTPSIFLLAAVGFLFSFKKKNVFLISLGLITIFMIFQMNTSRFFADFLKILLILLGTVSIRVVVLLIVFLPILAAFGAWSLGEFLLWPIIKLFPKRDFLQKLFCSLAAFVITLTVVLSLSSRLKLESYDVFYSKYKLLMSGNFKSDNFLPTLKISKTIPLSPLEKEWKQLVDELNFDPTRRLDICPESLQKILQTWPLFSQTPTVAAYEYYSVINKAMSGYRNSVLYGLKPEQKNPSLVINELAKWFGINDVWLHQTKDDPTRYDSSWTELRSTDSLSIKEFNQKLTLFSWSNKPAVLVIGRFDKRAFEQVFRTANMGGIPYDQAMLVSGNDSGRIDDYSLEELKRFEIVFLYGYTYQNKNKAWTLLSDYVKSGGSLFIETGWQYVSPDWQQNSLPEPLPLKRLIWKNIDKQWNLILPETEADWKINPSAFADPVWKGKPWGVSTATKDDLRLWARPILLAGDRPLIVTGNFGQGKVVWSGMNLIGHALTYQNEEELTLLSKIISFLKETSSSAETPVDYKRDYPDQVQLTFNQPSTTWTTLYWREAYFPSWKVQTQGKRGDYKIYRAGPDLMLVRIPPHNGSIKMGFYLDETLTMLSKIISLSTFILLLVYFLKPVILTKIFRGIRFPGKPRFLQNWWGKEE